jgi:hypothetical protein
MQAEDMAELIIAQLKLNRSRTAVSGLRIHNNSQSQILQSNDQILLKVIR